MPPHRDDHPLNTGELTVRGVGGVGKAEKGAVEAKAGLQYRHAGLSSAAPQRAAGTRSCNSAGSWSSLKLPCCRFGSAFSTSGWKLAAVSYCISSAPLCVSWRDGERKNMGQYNQTLKGLYFIIVIIIIYFTLQPLITEASGHPNKNS